MQRFRFKNNLIRLKKNYKNNTQKKIIVFKCSIQLKYSINLFILNNYFLKKNKFTRIKSICMFSGKYKKTFRSICINRWNLKNSILNNKVPNIKKFSW